TVEDSVLFRGVRIMERAFVSNSIVMEGCEIGNDCVIEYAILDKEVVLTNGITVRGTAENPRIIPKGSVI
ncbi:MAG: glucose-1-phosphate adenylyltransferase subunit GlgD, partial [Defluviitaleaceae bacterium]|nr:glucose-1-phosphate adenylyltransferase subunit GlgD [Defluviitaleaceae bacterium]